MAINGILFIQLWIILHATSELFTSHTRSGVHTSERLASLGIMEAQLRVPWNPSKFQQWFWYLPYLSLDFVIKIVRKKLSQNFVQNNAQRTICWKDIGYFECLSNKTLLFWNQMESCLVTKEKLSVPTCLKKTEILFLWPCSG